MKGNQNSHVIQIETFHRKLVANVAASDRTGIGRAASVLINQEGASHYRIASIRTSRKSLVRLEGLMDSDPFILHLLLSIYIISGRPIVFLIQFHGSVLCTELSARVIVTPNGNPGRNVQIVFTNVCPILSDNSGSVEFFEEIKSIYVPISNFN